MKLTWKLTVFLVLGTLAVTAVHAVVRIRREATLFEADIRRDNHLLGRTVASAATRMWEHAGPAQAIALVGDVNEREAQVEVRWVWLDESTGEDHRPVAARSLLAPLRRGQVTVVRLRESGEAYDALVTYVPVHIPGNRAAAIELSESLAAERAFMRGTIRNVAIATVVTVLLFGIIAVALGAFIVGRPIRALVDQARRIGQGDLTRRITVARRDELGELSHEMNAMCDQLAAAHEKVAAETSARLRTIEQLRHADRLMTVGKLASGIAHELGTPINVVAGRAQLVVDDYEPGTPAHENATIIVAQSEKMATIIRQLLDFARRQPAQKSRQSVRPLMEQTVTMLAPMARKRGVELVVVADAEGDGASVDAGQLQQVLMNLVVNGIHAMPARGALTLSLRRVRATPPPASGGPEDEYLCLAVRDEGVGIAPEVVPHVFEPFFTTKDVGDGTGLGLSVAHGIVEEHRGWITVHSELGRGSCFEVYLPLTEGA